jgi:hypothetical protein
VKDDFFGAWSGPAAMRHRHLNGRTEVPGLPDINVTRSRKACRKNKAILLIVSKGSRMIIN